MSGRLQLKHVNAVMRTRLQLPTATRWFVGSCAGNCEHGMEFLCGAGLSTAN